MKCFYQKIFVAVLFLTSHVAHSAQHTYEEYHFDSDDDYFTDSDNDLPSVRRLQRYAQSYRNQRLYDKACAGRLKAVKKLVAAKAEVNYERASETNNQPLYGSIWAGDVKIVQFLLKHKADVHSTECPQNLPVHAAAKTGNIDIFKLLVQHKADVNARENPDFDDACTPLERASWAGKLPMVVHMLENHGDLDKKGKSDNYYVLFAAARAKELPSPALLNVVVEATQLPEAVCTFLIMPYADMFSAALVSDLNIHNKKGETPLHIAARAQNVAVCKHLFAAKADLEARTQEGHTPLRYAAKIDSGPAYTFLIKAGALVDNDNDLGKELCVAINNGYSSCGDAQAQREREERALLAVQALVERGAPVNRPLCARTQTFPDQPLTCAAGHGLFTIVDWLLHNTDADPDGQSGSGQERPLERSARLPDIRIAQTLLQAQPPVDVNAANKWGYTALMTASGARARNVAMVNLLLEHKADIHKGRSRGETPLWLAARTGFTDIIPTLLERRADPNVQGELGCRALHFVANNNDLESCKLLVEAQAIVDVTQDHGGTPLGNTLEQDYNYRPPRRHVKFPEVRAYLQEQDARQKTAANNEELQAEQSEHLCSVIRRNDGGEAATRARVKGLIAQGAVVNRPAIKKLAFPRATIKGSSSGESC